MIRRVRGRLLNRSPGSVEVMTAGGVGYELRVPAALMDRLPEEGQEVELDCALVVRDDAMELFGFGSAMERELFLRLQSASGVGPSLSLSLLGTLSAGRLVQAIRAKDHAALRTVTGVGKKTAERIAVELADKLDDLATEEVLGVEADSPAGSAVEALVSLGYARRESEKAVASAREEGDAEVEDGDTEGLVRAALQHL